MGNPTTRAARLPEIRVIGPVTITADGPIDPSHRRRLTELGVYLALHQPPASVAAVAPRVEAAVWPGIHPSPATRYGAVSRLRGWWGVDEHGHPYLERHTLRARTWSDWAQMRRLTGYTGGIARLDDIPTADLVEALQLVRGQPFTSPQWRALDWSDRIRCDIEYLIDLVVGEILTRTRTASPTARLARAARHLAMPWAS